MATQKIGRSVYRKTPALPSKNQSKAQPSYGPNGVYGAVSAVTQNQSMAISNQSMATQSSYSPQASAQYATQGASTPQAKPNLKLPNGQIISGVDPNYDVYKSQGAAPVQSMPNVPGQLGEGDLSSSPSVVPVDQPTRTNSVDGSNSFTESIKSTVPDPGNAASDAARKESEILQSRINELIDSGYAKGAYRTSQYDAVGLSEKEAGLSSLTKQYDALKAQYDSVKRGYDDQLRLVGRGNNLTGIIGGTQSKIRQDMASDLGALSDSMGALSVQSLAIQGDITSAKAKADQLVNDKYSAITNELTARQNQLTDARADLSAADKKKADYQLLLIDAQQKDIQSKKDEESSIADLMIKAGAANVGQEALSKIGSAGSYSEAARIAAPYLGIDSTSQAPQKIGSRGDEDLFFYKGQVVTGYILLGIDGGGAADILSELNDPIAFDWAKSIQDGTAKFSDLTGDPELKSRVNSVMRTLPPSDAAIKEAEDMLADLRRLYDPESDTAHPGLDSAVGSFITGRIPVADFFTGKRDDFMSIASKVISKQALDSLIESKSQGATFGALSDTEMAILKAARSAIASREGKTGFNLSEGFFKGEIKKFINDYQEIIDKAKDPLQLGDIGGPAGDADSLTVFGKLSSYKDGQKGGQCGAFVNKLTGIGLGDEYEQKLSKMDWTYKDGYSPTVEPGMVFISPYSWTGHAGIITKVNNDGTVTVRDSNYSSNNDELVRTRNMPISQITGLARV